MSKKTFILIFCILLTIGIWTNAIFIKKTGENSNKFVKKDYKILPVPTPIEEIIKVKVEPTPITKIIVQKNKIEILRPKSNNLPALPLLEKGCQGECCGILNSFIVKKDTDLRGDANLDSQIIGRAAIGTNISFYENYIKTIKYGKGKVTKSNIHSIDESYELKVGDSLVIVKYLGNSLNHVWVKGKMRVAELIPEEILDRVLIEEWIKIGTNDGIEGWFEFNGDHLDWRWCE